MRMNLRTNIFVLALVCFVAGCGGGGGNSTSSASPAPTPAPSDPLAHWHVRVSHNQVFAFSDFAYGNGTYVSVGNYGSISTSVDAVRWTIRTSGTSNSLSRVIFANGLFVAVGANGTILSSADGISWTVGNSGTTNDIRDIVFGNGVFVAIDSTGINITSSDGMNWQTNLSFRQGLNAITYGNGVFVALGINFIATSADGITWSPATADVTNIYASVAYGNNTFIVTSSDTDKPTTVLISTDGVHWSAKDAGFNLDRIRGRIIFGAGKFLAFSTAFDSATDNYTNSFATSSDGVTWTFGDSFNIGGTGGVLCSFTNNQFICGGTASFSGITSIVAYYTVISRDGLNWTQRFVGEAYSSIRLFENLLRGTVTYQNGLFSYYDPVNMFSILTSSDGETWTLESPTDNTTTALNLSYMPPSSLNIPSQVIYANGMFVGIPDEYTTANSSIMTSADGINWTISNSGVGAILTKIAHGNDIFVAVGANGAILTSSDGKSWAAQSPVSTNYLSDLIYSDGTFVAVGDLGEIDVSADGAKWTRINAGTVDRLNGITYGNGTFVIVGSSSILTSADTITWKITPQTSSLSSVAFGGGSFVAVGSGGVITSSDGTNWKTRQLPENSFNGVTFGDGTFVIKGSSIYQSDPL